MLQDTVAVLDSFTETGSIVFPKCRVTSRQGNSCISRAMQHIYTLATCDLSTCIQLCSPNTISPLLSVKLKPQVKTIQGLNPELFSLETSFSLYMPLTHRISISVQAPTPKLNLSPLPALASRLVTLIMPTH